MSQTAVFTRGVSKFQDRKLTVTEEPPGNGRPGILHFQSRPTVTKTIQWDAVLSSSALYVEIPLDPLPDGSKERWGLISSNMQKIPADLQVGRCEVPHEQSQAIKVRIIGVCILWLWLDPGAFARFKLWSVVKSHFCWPWNIAGETKSTAYTEIRKTHLILWG